MKIQSLILSVMLAISISCASAKTIKLTTRNTVTIRGEVSAKSMMKAQNDILKKITLLKKDQPLYLVLQSPGGSVFDGKALINFLGVIKNLKHPIHTVGLSAASMAFVILEYGDKRFAVKDAVLMSHRPAVGLAGQFNDGELESRLRMLKSYTTIIDEEIAQKIGISIKEYKKLVKDEWWLVGKEAKKQNVVDDIVTVECSKELIDSRYTITVGSFFFAQTINFSGCPLITYPLSEETKKSTFTLKQLKKMVEKIQKMEKQGINFNVD